MIKNRLSVIVVGICEWPQVSFTIRNIAEELEGRCDFQLLYIDNYCRQAKAQGVERDRSSEHIREQAKLKTWLKYFTYDEKLSHWNAKRVGVEQSDGDFLCFIDAHCIVGRNSLFDMFEYYKKNHEQLNGTIHLPLTYHILEDQKLIYQLIADPKKGVVHYKFINMPKDKKEPFEVPCMSCCGVMMTRALYDCVGGWPTELGTYGGGENFLNFTLPVLGKKKWVFPARPLYHHGAKRSYYYDGLDYFRNRIIASYIYGGQEITERFVKSYEKIGLMSKARIFHEAASKCVELRKGIEAKSVTSIEDWLASVQS